MSDAILGEKLPTRKDADENPATITRLLPAGDTMRRHAPAVLVLESGSRFYYLRAESEAQDLADLLAWEATTGGFRVHAGADGAFYAMQKGDTPQ